jgi:hypothetical protein
MLNCPAAADECRMGASRDVTQPLCKALLRGVIGTLLHFNLLCHRAAIARLHPDRRSIRLQEA